MKLLEINYPIGKDGLHIPLNELREMGFSAKDTVTVAFLSTDGRENSFREFLIYHDDAPQSVRIPTDLLEQAGITTEDDLRMLCCAGKILILRDNALRAEEMSEVLERLMLLNDFSEQLPNDPTEAAQILSDTLENILGGER